MTNTVSTQKILVNQFPDLTIIQLIVQEKQSELFGELFKRYYQKVLNTCKGFLKNYEDAQDVVQEVFTKAMLSLPRFQGRASFSTWLYHISINECITYARKRKKRYSQSFTEAIQPMDFSNELLNDKIQKEKEIEMMFSLINELPTEDRLLLEKKYLQKKTLKELMEELKISESALKMRLLRARNKVNKMASTPHIT